MRALLVVACLSASLAACEGVYPEYTPIIQEEILANRDQLAGELARRDPSSRIMFGMMVAKVRCDEFWQELERYRTGTDIAVANLNYIAKTISPVLQSGVLGPINETTVANTIWAIGLVGEFAKNQNELAFLGLDKYRTALREKWDQKQRDYYGRNKAYAEEIYQTYGATENWPRHVADEANFRVYEYARLCTRPELLMTFDQLLTDSRVVPDTAATAGSTTFRSADPGAASSTELPGFAVVN